MKAELRSSIAAISQFFGSGKGAKGAMDTQKEDFTSQYISAISRVIVDGVDGADNLNINGILIGDISSMQSSKLFGI